MAGVEISAAGINDGKFSAPRLIFKFEGTIGAGEIIFYERAGASRAKMSSFGGVTRLALDGCVFENQLEFFSFFAGNTRELFLFPVFVLSDKL